ncbi:MAG: mechanosensitive ion channel family protein [Bacteroidales bacterium]|nr:mechanosensitive ion channel family protein [Bacteroidales bacterium]
MEKYLSKWMELIIPWILTHGIKIALILAATYILNRILQKLIIRIIQIAVVSDNFSTQEAEKKRENTLNQIFSVTIKIIIITITSLMIMQELGMQIGPILASAGVVGLAFGFGGQYLIRDIITGLFIIIENQYRIGDVICVEGICGIVENISLRKTILRDMDGTVHHIPHGEIKKVSNLTKDFSCINLDIGISYNSELEHVINVVNKVGNDLARDPEWAPFIIKPPQFLRVNDFSDSAIVIKITGDTQPLKQWAVAGELRKRIKIAFDKEEIEIPFPQIVIHQQYEKRKKEDKN